MDLEKSTNGPYDTSFNSNIELQDDPGAFANSNERGDNIASTIEPHTVT